MANEYDDIADSLFANKEEAPVGGYDAVSNSLFEPSKKRFDQSQFVAKQKQPEQVTEAMKISREQNVPVAFVEKNLDLFKAKQEKTTLSYDAIIDRSPRLAKWLEDPSRAAMSNDDLDPLSRVERNVNRIRPYKDGPSYVGDLARAGKTGVDNLAASSMHLATVYGITDIETTAEAIAERNRAVRKSQEQLPGYAIEFQEAMAKEGGDVDKAVNRVRTGYQQLKEGKIIEGLQNFQLGQIQTVGEFIDQVSAAVVRPKGTIRSLTESIAFSAPALVTGVAAGKVGAAAGTVIAPGPGTVVGGVGGFAVGTFSGSAATEVGAWINQSLEERGYDTANAEDIKKAYSNKRLMAEIRGEAERKGLTTAGVDALFATVGGKFIKGAAGAGLVKKTAAVAKDVGVQAVGEAAGEFSGQVAAREGDFTKVSLGDAITEGIVSMGHSVGDVVVGSSFRGAKSKLTTRAVEEVVTDAQVAQDSLNEIQALSQLGELAQESQLQTRDPEVFAEFIESVNLDSGEQAVYFQKDDWDDYWKSKGESPVVKAEELLGSGDAYQDAKDSGQPIAIPLKDYVSKLGPEPEFQELMELVQTQPDGMKVSEAAQVIKDLPATIEELAQESRAEREIVEQREIEIKAIEEKVQSEIVEAGQGSKLAKNVAAINSAAMRTFSERSNLSPVQIAKKIGLRIQRSDIQRIGSLNKKEEAPEGKMFSVNQEQFAEIESLSKNKIEQKKSELIDQGFSGIEIKKEDGYKYYVSLKSDEKVLFQKTPKQEAGLDPDELGYYSKLKNEVLNMSFKKMPAKDLKGRIQNLSGIKKDELEWTGVLDYLDMREAAGEQVSKDELVNYLVDNGVTIKQVVLGSGQGAGAAGPIEWNDQGGLSYGQIDPYGDLAYEDAREHVRDVFNADTGKVSDWAGEWLTETINEFKKEDPEITNEQIEEKLIESEEEIIIDQIENGESHWSEFLHEATVKDQNGDEIDIEIRGSDERMWMVNVDGDRVLNNHDFWSLDEAKIQAQVYLQEERDVVFAEPEAETEIEPAQIPEINQPTSSPSFASYATIGGTNYREILLTLPNHRGDSFDRSHWSYTNTIAHIRSMDRVTKDGKNIFHVDEIQSDWHQKGRDLGYKEREDSEELKRLADVSSKIDADFKKILDSISEVLTVVRHRFNDNLRKNLDKYVDVLLPQIEAFETRQRDGVEPTEFKGLVDFGGDEKETAWHEILEDGSHEIKFGFGHRHTGTTLRDALESYLTETALDGSEKLFFEGTAEEKQSVKDLENRLNILTSASSDIESKIGDIKDKIPQAPFKSSDAWGALAFKRALSMAIQEGKDALIITPGKIHSKRYNMKNFVDSINYKKIDDNKYTVNAFGKDKNKVALPSDTFTLESISETFGQSIADKIKSDEGVDLVNVEDDAAEATGFKELRDADLEIDEQGHVTFYDKILAKAIGKMVKKLDKKAKLTVKKTEDLFGEQLEDASSGEQYSDVWYLEITPGMKEAVQKGQTLFQEEKGQIQFGDNQAIITLFEKADKSTLIHELGHYYLELIGKMAVEDNVNHSLWRDHKTILEFLGVDDTSEIKTEHHEKWARAFEQYIREGKAPSSRLRKIFNEFKVWLTNIYRRAAELDVELNDEIRGVFDRMLATSEEITQAQQSLGDQPLFENPIDAGMTRDQAQRYRKASEESKLYAEEQLQKKLVNQEDRKKKKQYQAAKKKIKSEVTDEVNSVPLYNNMAILKTGKMADGSPLPEGTAPIKLSRADFKTNFPEHINNSNFKGMFSKSGGFTVEMAAGLLGYESADVMINDMAVAPKKQESINALTDDRMEKEFPDLLNSDEISAEAEKLIHNEDRSKRLRMEYEFLAENKKGVARDITRRVSRRPTPQADIKRYAEQTINNMYTGSLKPNSYRLAERKYAKLAGEQLAKGDVEAAFDAKQKELINHELYRSATEAKARVEKDIKNTKKIFDKNEKIAKTRDMDLVSAARAILSRYGLGKSNKDPMAHLEKIKEYNPDSYETLAGIVVGVIENPDDYKNIPYGQFKDVMDSVKALWDLAKDAKEIEVDGKKFQIDKVNQDLISEMQKFKKPQKQKKYNETASDWEKMKTELLGVKAMVRRFEHWVDVMDLGKISGPFRSFLFKSVSDANTEFLLANKKYKEKFRDLSKPVADKIDLGEAIISDEIGFKFKDKGELLGALLHTGNEGNLRKLLVGRGWGMLDEDNNLIRHKWDAFIKRMQDEGILTKEDYDYVQSLWDLMEELKPKAQTAHKKVFGFYFDEVTAVSFDTPWGKYKGGYAPAKVDPQAVTDIARKQELEEFIKGHSSYTYPASGGRGFTMSRVQNFNKPLNIDISLVGKHIEDVLRFAIIKPAVVDTAKVIMSQDFKSAMGEIDPVVIEKMIKPALNRADKNTIQVTDPAGSPLIRRVGATLRRNASMQLMFANTINTIEQFGGLGISATRISPKYLSRGMYRYMMNPRAAANAMAEKSGFMKVRTDDQVFEMDKASRNIFKEETNFMKMKDFAHKHTFFMQSFTQNIIDTITWSASYDESIAQGKTDKQAVQKADADVRITQSSRRPIDISNLETNVTLNFFQMFMNFFNMMANVNTSNFTKLYYEDIGMKKKFAKGFYLYMMGFATVAVVSASLRKAAAGDLDEDEDGEYIDDLYDVFIGSQIDLALAMVPVVGQGVNAGLNQANDKFYDDRVSASPAVSAVTAVAGTATKLFTGKLTDDKRIKGDVRDGLTALGIVTGLPLYPLSKPINYSIDIQQGKARPSGPFDAARGFVTGKPGTK